ncbi:hypothetical protein GT755_18380 [Herbidospora sp. NEAU-GS84]|uniref:Uncharacterized protein n=1 Tax=Herbidospora solisilvae TaxID=2696284 RepID=A0A7C9NFI6_9ACTN|nr:beta-L-arabinofuranosidase domain-containing protein [Herbidospora solisilvae]NAS23655.1 hypothetical protein [Herbidospora solisilvae]
MSSPSSTAPGAAALAGWAYAAPTAVIVAVLFVAPLVLVVVMSLRRWPLLGPARPNFPADYTKIPDDPLFLDSVLFTLRYTVIITILLSAVALGLALLVQDRRPRVGFFRTAFFLPGAVGFYNPLQVRVAGEVTSGVSPRADGGLRASWRAVSCCPTNLARTFAALPAYVATGTDAGLQLHHPTSARVEHDGFVVEVDTEMPWRGAATLRVVQAPDRLRVLSLRLPIWAGGGTAEWCRVWAPGEEVSVDLRMTPRWVEPDPRIDALRGCVAVERGPLVYCAESPGDQPPLTRITVDTSRASEVVDEEIAVSATLTSAEDQPWPYGPRPRAEAEAISLRLRPYYQWGNHGPATMRVWLPKG